MDTVEDQTDVFSFEPKLIFNICYMNTLQMALVRLDNKNYSLNIGPVGLRAPPVVAVASVAGHC